MKEKDLKIDSKKPILHETLILKVQSNGLMAVEKPKGVLSHPNHKGLDKNALLPFPYDSKSESYITPEGPIYLLHRLDSATSGVILLSKNKSLTDFIKSQFKEDKIQKTYYALVFQKPTQNEGIWKDQLLTTHLNGKLRTKNDPRGYPSITHFKQVQYFPKQGTSLLKLMPKTGRTHQLRVQCALHNLPIIGDKTYGDFERNRIFEKQFKGPRLFLHAFSISLKLPNGELFYAESPLPKEFNLTE